jgi:hypothetical protein
MSKTGDDVGTVADRCRAAGGMLRTILGELRESLGYKRLGKYVLEEMAESLTLDGLGWLPAWRLSLKQNDEPRQDQELWVFVRDGGLRCQVVGVVQAPDGCDVPAVLNDLLAGRPQKLSPERKVALIREILGSWPAAVASPSRVRRATPRTGDDVSYPGPAGVSWAPAQITGRDSGGRDKGAAASAGAGARPGGRRSCAIRPGRPRPGRRPWYPAPSWPRTAGTAGGASSAYGRRNRARSTGTDRTWSSAGSGTSVAGSEKAATTGIPTPPPRLPPFPGRAMLPGCRPGSEYAQGRL